MPLRIPTTQEQVDQNIAKLESSLNQETPDVDIAFNKVISVVLSLANTSLYKYAAERALQNLVLTATGDDLDRIGNNYGVVRKQAEAAVVEVSLPSPPGVLIPATVIYTADANGLQYFPLTPAIAAAGFAVHDVRCEQAGVSGNLILTDTLQIDSQIGGAGRTATVTALINTGAEKESDSAYKPRILSVIRSPGGGGNTADYKRWSEEVAGVLRAYPYSGNPTDLATDDGSSVPPERTVYVEADPSIDPDGIAPPSLLDEVKAAIITNPDTGISNQPLGITDALLFVVSISRISIYIRITGLAVDPTLEAQVKSQIQAEFEKSFLLLRPFIPGLDAETERNDTLTDVYVSDIVQGVITAYGASAENVEFGLTPGVYILKHVLLPGQLAKLGLPIVYV